jgi:hypothetical protein
LSSALRQSLIAAISSMPAFIKTFENCGLAGCLSKAGVADPTEAEASDGVKVIRGPLNLSEGFVSRASTSMPP